MLNSKGITVGGHKMLRPAQSYESEIKEKELKCWYDPKYMYYDGYTGNQLTNIGDNSYDRHCFVSVDENDEIVGMISYNISYVNMSVDNFGIISYEHKNVLFMRDVMQAIHDIFNKYHMNRLEWFCFADNPAIKSYRKLIEKYGVRECGYFRKVSRLQDGLLHDSVVFEILAEDIKHEKENNCH